MKVGVRRSICIGWDTVCVLIACIHLVYLEGGIALEVLRICNRATRSPCGVE